MCNNCSSTAFLLGISMAQCAVFPHRSAAALFYIEYCPFPCMAGVGSKQRLSQSTAAHPLACTAGVNSKQRSVGEASAVNKSCLRGPCVLSSSLSLPFPIQRWRLRILRDTALTLPGQCLLMQIAMSLT